MSEKSRMKERILNCIEFNEESNYVQTIELLDTLLDTYGADLAKETSVIPIESDYVGLHLGDYEKQDFFKLISYFSNYQTLHASYTQRILCDALNILKQQPNIRKCLINDDASHAIIVGDLHGNFRDLKHIIEKYGMPGDEYQFVFNGDFVDRGTQQIEVLLTLLYAFILDPSRVFLNRGNHENKSCNTNSNFYPNFMNDTNNKYGQYYGMIFETAEELFSYLPLATIVTNCSNIRAFVCHGGISYNTDLEFIEKHMNRHLFKRITTGDRLLLEGTLAQCADIVTDLLWSDPITFKNDKLRPKEASSLDGCFHNTSRKVGIYFGQDLLRNFCEKYKITWLIRSHEVREDGFSQDQDRCFTIFSASRYCGGSNHGALIYWPFNSSEFQVYKYITSLEAPNEAYGECLNIIERFKRVLIKKQVELMKKFEEFDEEKSGVLNLNTWAKCIAQVLDEIEPNDVILMRDYLCECDDKTQFVHYLRMFPILNENNELLKNLFDIMDKNHNGKISCVEAKQALELIQPKIGHKQTAKYLDLIMSMDKDGDSQIDFNEFKYAFKAEI